ncbi:hypothetical protein GCM10007925_10790 [Sphingomonas astaxanthinifaciens DSM 22298]|uniref:Chitooligosaccharide deacetylase n=1 Tax=Sphingomonas astaxanthinifaciens DSM 22298 TaxID=1123267 RepID=A0ABQ5Z3K4_9SPHN|nr:hypothetical protein GCM10007925_10790 [Sphingomonas astaxanthinifaciens DSM 22298]
MVLAALACLAAAWSLWVRKSSPAIFEFENVSGPEEASSLPQPVAMRVSDYDRGGPNRLAVLVTDPESDWMGLVRGFKSHGIPATFTTSPNTALRHQVVIAYPGISGRLVSQAGIRALADHVRTGGTLLTMDLAGGGLEELFGIERQLPSRERTAVRWLAPGDRQDRLTPFSSAQAEVKIGSLSFVPTTAQTLARYDDGSAAVVCRQVGGTACLLGVDLGSMAQRAMNGRAEGYSPEFVNNYEPGMDVVFRWIRDLYVQGEDDPYLIGTAPAGHRGSLILTHDVDASKAVANSQRYAEAIRKAGSSATFFMQTKYVRDWNDDIFFNSATVSTLKSVAQNMELASHTVAHSRAFKAFPIGSGDERYPDYRPFVRDRTSASGGSIFGELRVSKFLLERLVGAKVRSFRPGHLSYPENLPEALAATGYRYSSDLTANSAQTHLPFQLSYGRSGRGLVPVWEFPVTIEDEKAPALVQRFGATVDVLDRIAAHESVAVLMIHPDQAGPKLQFEERLIARMKDKLWIGSLEAFGDWWSARDRLEIDYEGSTLKIQAPARVDEVTIRFPKRRTQRFVVLDGLRGSRQMSVQ